MLLLTLLTSPQGFISFNTTSDHAVVVGEFLIADVAGFPSIIRDFIDSQYNQLEMDACTIIKQNEFCLIKHRWIEYLPTVRLTKERLLEIIDIWSEFLKERRPTQWLFLHEDELGLPPATDEESLLLKKMEEDFRRRFAPELKE